MSSSECITAPRFFPGREDVEELTAVQLLEIEFGDLKYVWKWEKRDGQEFPHGWLDVEAHGKGEHLPDSLSCKVLCTVLRRTKGLATGDGTPFDTGTAALKKDGADWKLTAQIDLLEAGLVGAGTVRISLLPTYPHAVEMGNWELDLDVPAGVQLVGVDFSKPLLIGAPLTVIPEVESNLGKLSGFQMRLEILELQDGRSEAEKSVLETFVWKPGEKQSKGLNGRAWRVGTGFRGGQDQHHEESAWHLTCAKPREVGDYECRAEVTVSLDEGKTTKAVWAQSFTIKRPSLEAFAVTVVDDLKGAARDAVLARATAATRKKVRVEGRIAGMQPAGLGWNLDVTLWGGRPNDLVEVHQAGATKGKASKTAAPTPAEVRLLAEPVTTLRVPLAPDGSFRAGFELWRLPSSEAAIKGCYGTYFATVSFAPQVTASDTPAPITNLMNVDPARFPLVDPDDLMEHGANRPDAVAACSDLGNPAPKIERLPHIASIVPMVSGEDLVFEVHLAGSQSHWKGKQVRLLIEEAGKERTTSTAGERAETPDPAPHVRSFRVPMNRADIFGKRIVATAEVDAEPPLRYSLEYDCVPALENLHWHEQEDGSWFIACDAHFLPTYDGKHTSRQTARLYFAEERKLKSGERFDLHLPVQVSYHLPAGGEGLASKSGHLTARASNLRAVRETDGRIVLCAEGSVLNQGRILVCVDPPPPAPEPTLFGLPVAQCRVVVKDGPVRLLEHKLPFGKCVSVEFKKKLVQVGAALSKEAGKDEAAEDVADHLMQIMELETNGTFSPGVTNPTSKAIGLIQFIIATNRDGPGDQKIAAVAGERWKQGEDSPTIQRLKAQGGDTQDKRIEMYRKELASMSPVAQLDCVQNFLCPTVRQYHPKGLREYYLTVFLPSGLKSEAGLSSWASGNPSLATNGRITYASIDAALAARAKPELDADIGDPPTPRK